MNLGLKLPLDSYLLKPVQRISKYQLLLKELNKSCTSSDKPMVEQALETMLDVVKNLNDIMHASFIVGFTAGDIKSIGRLLKRDQLQMTKLKRNSNGNRTSSAAMNVVNRFQINNKSVEVFLFEKAILICKRKSDDPVPGQPLMVNNPYTSSTSTLSSVCSSNGVQPNSASTSTAFQYFYQFKEMIGTNEIGLTENLKNDKKKFEIWSETCSYVFEAQNEQEKQMWITQIKSLLENQLNEMKCNRPIILSFVNNQLNDPIVVLSEISVDEINRSQPQQYNRIDAQFKQLALV